MVPYSTTSHLGTAPWKAPFAFAVAFAEIISSEATFVSSIASTRVEVVSEGRVRASLGCHIGTQLFL